ncbi:hypothetical protein Ngar_c17060 [Candidatus Nitrososphaera gargensis Ga9.2]|uniref:SpoVT-AbrB domain-containing protein n=1 Tax=Nitrososphaera gargensis (strain Ga9.2) TaxID=1237085 RepID=K0IN26_NITGG|nr:AbrB/MazE/SpoVT family DNA-binding domain-containing protein [Candidatus Nitrososphaera gargensis]AFU58639.1 hypothetical protein Ngar_c17060 [Candidatus Nitrososphaera gargensis Ga9.2]
MAIEEMSAIFEGTLVKWGNSLGVVIPKPVQRGMALKPGEKIRFRLEKNKLCIEKIEKKED